MQRKIAKQIVKLVLMADKVQVAILYGRLQQLIHDQLGNAIRDADSEANRRRRRGVAQKLGHLLSQGEDLVGLAQHRFPASVITKRRPAGFSSS